jgi:hypothetical protein
MQTIITKLIPATNNLPTRFTAKTESGAYKTTASENELEKRVRGGLPHATIAQMLLDKIHETDSGWQGELVGGSTPSGWCFVFVDGSPKIGKA